MAQSVQQPTPGLSPATANHLLGALETDDLARLANDLEYVALRPHDVLYEPHAAIEYVYFPTLGCVSMINITPEGCVEVGTIGREGMVGVPILLGAESEPTRALVQVDGDAYRIARAPFLEAIEASDAMQSILLRYVMALFNQVAQSVACNRLHSLEARCARWLLMTHDRVDGDKFELTQEFLSYMLGVHRPAVTLAAGLLQRAGFIHYTRGRISVTDRAGLERASCSCYQATRDDFASLAF